MGTIPEISLISRFRKGRIRGGLRADMVSAIVLTDQASARKSTRTLLHQDGPDSRIPNRVQESNSIRVVHLRRGGSTRTSHTTRA